MISAVNANPQCYIYIVGAFAAVCVTCDLALSCLSQTSGSMVAFSAMLFLLGFAAQAQEELQARCAKPSPPRELHRGRSAASECEGRTGQPAARGRGGCAAAPAARPTAERGPRRAGQAVEPQPEPPERPRHIPWFVRRGLAGAQVTAEGEDTPQGPAPSRAMRQRTAADASASARKGGQAGQSPTDSTIGQQLSTRSSAVRLRTTADAAASASEGEKAGPSSTSSTEFQSDAACDAEEASTDRRPEEIPTATERTPLSREAPTFVPRTFEDPLRMLLDASAWCRQDLYAPRQYGQFPQIAAQQMDPHPVGQYDLFPHIAAQQVDTCDLAQNDHFPQIAAHQMDPCALGQYGQFPQIAAQLMGGPQDECTTVMLRNLPCPFLREDLIKAMDAKGFAGLYNFVYMPIDFQTAMGMGYAFVNLISAEEMQRFTLSFTGFKNWPLPSSKVCVVALSRTQGLDANIARYRNSSVMSDGVPERFRPVLFEGTERVAFPEPSAHVPVVFRGVDFPLMATHRQDIQRDECTTVMLRHLPSSLLREDMIKLLDAEGFAGTYNFVYVHIHSLTEMCMGYAIINMVSTAEVQRLASAFQGFGKWPVPSSKVCSVQSTWIQGLDANIARYRNSPVNGDGVPERFKPVLFNGTERILFPGPTGEYWP